MIDIDELTNIDDISEQLDYIFDTIDDLKIKKRYQEIDESINLFIKNSLDLDVILFAGFLTILGKDDNIKNYNKLYHEILNKCKDLEETVIEQIVRGLKRNDYNEWIRTIKIKKIYEHKNL